jgi:hypothetical protein
MYISCALRRRYRRGVAAKLRKRSELTSRCVISTLSVTHLFNAHTYQEDIMRTSARICRISIGADLPNHRVTLARCVRSRRSVGATIKNFPERSSSRSARSILSGGDNRDASRPSTFAGVKGGRPACARLELRAWALKCIEKRRLYVREASIYGHRPGQKGEEGDRRRRSVWTRPADPG